MTKEELIKENKDLKEELEYLKSTMDKTLGHTFTKELVDKAELELAIIKTNKVLEKRDWN
jgi:hypothetical protein